MSFLVTFVESDEIQPEMPAPWSPILTGLICDVFPMQGASRKGPANLSWYLLPTALIPVLGQQWTVRNPYPMMLKACQCLWTWTRCVC